MSKKIFIAIILSFLGGVFYLLFSDIVFATVGGPTLLSDFAYDEKEKLVYFVENNGMNWSDTIYRYNPSNQEILLLSSWSYQTIDLALDELRQKEIEEIWSKLKPLPRIDLKKNGFEMEISLPPSMPKSAYKEYYVEIPLKATIKQQGKRISEIEFMTCDNPRVYLGEVRGIEEFGVHFDGLFVPNSNTILLLVSTMGVCREEIYVLDKVFPIAGVKIIDPKLLASLSDARREECPADASPPASLSNSDFWPCRTRGGIYVSVPNTIVVTEDKPAEEPVAKEEQQPEAIAEEEYPKPQKQERKLMIFSLIIGVILLTAILLLFYLKKKLKKS